MRGEIEKESLRFLQRYLGSIEGKINFFGCSKEEIRKLKILILEATENQNLNDFPDIIFENGFIEHFQITSSKETRKGSQHTVTEIIKDREFEKEISNLKEEFYNTEQKTQSKEKFQTHSVEGHEHTNLINSLKNNSENHLKSFENYEQDCDTRIFMIQYTDGTLETKNIEDDTLKHRLGFTPYYPHLDKELLLFLKEISEKINYVIFGIQATSPLPYPMGAHFEVFSTKNLDTIISELQNKDYEFKQIEGLKVTQEYRILS